MKKENYTRRRFLQSSLTAASLALAAQGQTPPKEVSGRKEQNRCFDG